MRASTSCGAANRSAAWSCIDPVRVIATSNNAVRLSFLTALLADAGIETIVLDAHASVMDGSIGAIPRRLCVATDDEARARRVLQDAGEL
jgi:Putative prokaryotic signal transducing protein